MSMRFKGGVISATPPTITPPVDGEGGSASGTWTLQTQLQNSAIWPKPPIPKQLWAWGNNTQGQLGLNDTDLRSSPVQVGALTDWSRAVFGNSMIVAVKTNGTMWSWGYNGQSRLGLGDAIPRSSPVQIGALTDWSKVDTSVQLGGCIAIKTNGTLWSWGSNTNGVLGLNDVSTRSSPTQIGSLTNWKQASIGSDHCAAVKTDGTLWTWGNGASGQLGSNTGVIFRSSPVQVGALTNWSQVSAGQDNCIAIKTDGTLWSWGRNYDGELGLNTRRSTSGYPDYIPYNQVSSPTQVGALNNWAYVRMKARVCVAVKTDGTLWSWGDNNFGNLGQNNTILRSSPVQVGSLTTWAGAYADAQICVARKTDGTLWSWGQNTQGQLGLNDTVSRSSPVQVGALTTWLSASAGSLAIKKP